MIVTMPSAEIFRYPFNSDNSFGIERVSLDVEANDEIQLKLSINPPPAKAEDFRKFRLLSEGFDSAIAMVYRVLIDCFILKSIRK
jgi:hypothetical protein